MKKLYENPEMEFMKIVFIGDALIVSGHNGVVDENDNEDDKNAGGDIYDNDDPFNPLNPWFS